MRQAISTLFIISLFSLSAQLGPRSWQDHLSINSCNTVSKLGTTIFASYYNGIIKFDQEEISPVSLNKIKGLNDVGVRLLRANPFNNKLLVIYENSNIDVIDLNGSVQNYPDIKLKTMTAKKIINEVTFYKQFAYLACGFGIVVFDTDKLEIKETYIIGPNASNLEIYQVALNDSLIFAATQKGLLRSNHKTKTLNNFNAWQLDSVDIPKGPYCGVVQVAGKILCCYSPFKTDIGKKDQDTVYLFENQKWIKYPPMKGIPTTIEKFSHINGNLFSYIDRYGLVVIDFSSNKTANVFNRFNQEKDPVKVLDAYFAKDHTGNISYWIADQRFGLYQTYFDYLPDYKVKRNGINKNEAGSIDVTKGKVAVAPSFIHYTGVGKYTREGVNVFHNQDWTYVSSEDLNGEKIIDINAVLIDRKDTSRMWVSSWESGVMLYKNNQLQAVYTASNSPMGLNDGDKKPRCSGLSMDKEGNVWFAQMAATEGKNYFLGAIDRKGQYYAFTFPGSALFTRKSFIDKNNYLWLPHEWEGGLTVFKLKNFEAPVKDVNYKVLTKDQGNGNLESNSVYCVTEDRDGKIWVGTAAGIRVFYNPTAIFSGSDFDAQPIKIIQDGNVELLLGGETITALAVDGANNKWVGTAYGGVYCFSPDGLRELYHFTSDNSPLYANAVFDLNYDETSGDVFIATEQGLQSFRSIIVEGSTGFEELFAFPNPVKPNYAGTVLVRGLIDGSIVKITDISGNLVWETKVAGGQIEWPLKTFTGNRVSSGVYLIYASTATGEINGRGKILVIN
jgi:hypothetical protein